jgi:hypothetical protein
MELIAVTVGLVFANFLYQAFFQSPDWKNAFERSYFQVVAILCVWLFA